MNFETIVTDVEACLDGYKWPYNHDQIVKMVDHWMEAKVVFDDDSLGEINVHKYQAALSRLRLTYAKNTDYSNLCLFDYVTDSYKVCSQFVSNGIRVHFGEYRINTSVGTKVSRVLGRFFRSIGLDKMEGYNHNYAILSDALNPLKITRFSLLSVHPCDYLNMSHGTGWESCHSIEDDGGCHAAGT